jgi:threonine/homoserine/homoserine lactone efflux protein
MTIGSIAALFGTMLVLSAVPGPSDFAVAARSASAGFTHGLLMVLGIVAADLLFILAAVCGLAALAEHFGTAFRLAQYGCGVYLIWLGWSLWKSKSGHADSAGPASPSGFSSFSSGFLITLGDPKAILFYASLLPAFLDLSRVSATSTIAVMLIATAVICGVKLSYAWMADRARELLGNPAARKKADAAAAAVLASIGVFILLRSWQPSVVT